MSGFGGNVVRKSKKSKGSKGGKRKGKRVIDRNREAIAKFNGGDDFAMMDLAMQYQLEETLANGDYF